MRKISKKGASKRVRDLRAEFLEDMGYQCAVCGRCFADNIAAHEMTPGKNRQRAIDCRPCLLPACGRCNCNDLTDATLWPLKRQLALKLLVDPAYFDLQAVRIILAPKGCENPPRVVDEYEILAEVRNLLMQGYPK